jgi:hypothetical protein
MPLIKRLIVILIVLTSGPSISAQPEVIPLRLEYRFPPPDSVGSDYYIAHLTDMELMGGGLIAVLDQMQNVLLIVNEAGDLVRQVGRSGQGPGEFFRPWDVEYDETSGLIWVLGRGRVQAFLREDFSFSHMIRPTEVRPMDMVAEGGRLYLSGSSAVETDLVYCYTTEGVLLGTLGTHLEREVGAYGRSLHKGGNLAATYEADGSLLLCYAYAAFNDILMISGDGQNLVHSDYPVVVEQDKENRKKARDWPDPDEGPTPYILVGDPYLVGDRFFLGVRYGIWQKDVPILEMDLSGNVQRVWIIPAEYGAPLSFAVQMEGDEPVFWMGWSYPEPNVGRMVSAR